MSRFRDHIITNKSLYLIVVIGVTLRLSFFTWGAEKYFNRENIHYDKDTQAWSDCIQNLIEQGTYTMYHDEDENEHGYFARLPGYSFFIGIFYLLTGRNWDLAYILIAYFQLLLDIACILLIFTICQNVFGQKPIALTAALLYATYPFVIVWNPVVYAETLGVFYMLVSVYFFLSPDNRYNYILSGIFVSIGMLTRPQVAFVLLAFVVAIVFMNALGTRAKISAILQLGLTVALIYGTWPLRNFINHDRIMFTMDYRGLGPHWDEDVNSFRRYIYFLKAEAEPQFSQIIRNEELAFPKNAYKVEGDSAKLARAVKLSKTCGRGFSLHPGYWKGMVGDNNCNEEIMQLFSELTSNQLRYNTINAWLLVPIQNLRKCLFKMSLYEQSSTARRLASFLFIYRSLLILLGILGLIAMLRSGLIGKELAIIILFFFASWYFTISFFHRNIEMRYLLPVDVSLLIPAAFILARSYSRWFGK